MTVASPLPAPTLLLDGVVEVRETHISWVFLTADRAYKVKKPLVLPYLDYGTAARRRAMCEEEVSLNRRLAPHVYVGVRGLAPAPHGLRLVDADHPDADDFAVEMRRYDEAQTLAARMRAGTVGPAEIAAVGERLAAFHAAAAPEFRLDGAEAVKRLLDDNFATLHRLAPDRESVARAERSAGAYLAAAWDELDTRAAHGCVRDGHGDLRLEHVIVGDDIAIVDCVEFDPALRRIDVAADLAFLIMELREGGRHDLAETLVGSYRAVGGDPGGDTLLAFFAAYRAEVRAKVALTRAGQLDWRVGHAERLHASALLALAARQRWAASAPMVIAVAGVAASGKSTIARALATASGFAHLNSDVVRKRRAGLQATDRAPALLYASEVSRATYAALGRLAAADAGRGVIVDATFRRRADRDAFRDAICGDARVLYVECRAPAALVESRARARARERGRVSDAGLEIVRRQITEAEPLDEVLAADHVIVRSDRPVAATLRAIADAVDDRAARTVVSPTHDRSSRGVMAAAR